MNALCEALRLGDAPQKRDQLRALRRVEGRQQLGVVLLGNALEVSEHVAPPAGEVERVRSPVREVGSSLGKPAMLEVVDQRDHGAAMDPERDAEGLLGLALGRAEVAEHPEVAGMEVELGQAIGEAPMRVGAQLHQEEPGTAAQRPRWD